MAILWSYSLGKDYYEVRTAGASVRLYRNGVHHSQWNPKRPLSGSVWDLLALPALYRECGSVRNVCVLGFGAGAVAGVLQAVASPDSITGVELDPMHLSIADGFFDCVEGCELVAGDAVEWAQGQKDVSSYDLIIDDLYAEENGLPIRCAPLDLEWFNCLADLVRPEGMLALNLVEPEKIPHLPPMQDKFLRDRFKNRLVFSLAGYENRVVVFSEAPLKAENCAAALKSVYRQYPSCRGVDRKYIIETL
jgi:spermidine synthase